MLSGELQTVKFAEENIVVRTASDPKLEWFLTTEEIARGYGANPQNIRRLKFRLKKELREGEHFVSVATKSLRTGIVPDAKTNTDAFKSTLWTKRGVIRLGLHLRSKRARAFRDFAENLILNHLETPKALPISTPRVLKTPRQKLLESFSIKDFKRLTPRERLKFLEHLI